MKINRRKVWKWFKAEAPAWAEAAAKMTAISGTGWWRETDGVLADARKALTLALADYEQRGIANRIMVGPFVAEVNGDEDPGVLDVYLRFEHSIECYDVKHYPRSRIAPPARWPKNS